MHEVTSELVVQSLMFDHSGRDWSHIFYTYHCFIFIIIYPHFNRLHMMWGYRLMTGSWLNSTSQNIETRSRAPSTEHYNRLRWIQLDVAGDRLVRKPALPGHCRLLVSWILLCLKLWWIKSTTAFQCSIQKWVDLAGCLFCFAILQAKDVSFWPRSWRFPGCERVEEPDKLCFLRIQQMSF